MCSIPQAMRYKSQHDSSVKEFYKSVKSTIPKTMGYAATPLRPPQDYLKKHSGEKKRESEAKSATCRCRELKRCQQSLDSSHSLQACPKEMEKHPFKKSDKRDFIRENVADVQKRPATAPEPRIVFDEKGNFFQLESSGLMPKYIHKKEYGRKPMYIEEIEKELGKSRQRIKELISDEQEKFIPKKLSEKEKEKIFKGLVRNWKELLSRYLKLPICTETPLQLKRKLEIERRIDSLARDIELLLKNKDIIIGKNKSFIGR